MVDITRFKGVVNQLTTGGPAGGTTLYGYGSKMVTLSHFDVPNWKTAQMATFWELSIPIVGMEKEKFDNYQAEHSTVSSDPNLNCHQFGDTVAGFSATILGITTITASKRSLKKFALPPRPSWVNRLPSRPTWTC